MRTGDIRLILLKMSRNPTDFCFQVRALERLSSLAAWHPETAKAAIEYGALKNAISMLKEVLATPPLPVPPYIQCPHPLFLFYHIHVNVKCEICEFIKLSIYTTDIYISSLMCLKLCIQLTFLFFSLFKALVFLGVIDLSSPTSPYSTSSSTFNLPLASSLASTTSSQTSNSKANKNNQEQVASPKDQHGALLVARPTLQLMATLCITSDAAVLQVIFFSSPFLCSLTCKQIVLGLHLCVI